MLALPSDQIAVWLCDPRALTAYPAHQARLAAVCDARERERWRRLVRPADRLHFLVAHALLRACLSLYTGVEPHLWAYARNATGQPRIDTPEAFRAMHFSLSHCEGLVACAVSWGRRVGIDVEYGARQVREAEQIAQHFAPEESRRVASAQGPARQETFMRLWTLKEAFGKAMGLGLHLPLDATSFRWDNGAVRATLPESAATDRWAFVQQACPSGHWLALAYTDEAAVPATVEVGWLTPTGRAT